MDSSPSPIPFDYDESDHVHDQLKDNQNRDGEQTPNAKSINNNKHSRNQPRSRSKSVNNHNNHQKDEKCNVCQKWCIDHNDFRDNFISCTYCNHSYHKKCIIDPNQFQTSLSFASCQNIKNRLNPKLLNQCDTSNDKQSELLIEYVDDNKYEPSNYIYDEENEPIYYDPYSKKLKDQLFHSQNVKQNIKLSLIQFPWKVHENDQSILIQFGTDSQIDTQCKIKNNMKYE